MCRTRTRYGFLESGAFRYPDRCALYMALCYCMLATGYLLRLGLGPATASCTHSQAIDPVIVQTAVIGPTSTPGNSCLLVFLMLYYFSNAAAVW